MKSYIKGVITGFAAGLALTFTFAMADNIEVALNGVRLNINGVDTVQWGENITSGGEETPSSILYNGTTYLPMRKLGEWYGKKVYWNGDSATVSITGAQEDVKKLAEKPDKNGNVWTYYTFKADDNSYIGGEIGGNGGNYSGSINAYNVITGETAVHEMGYRSAAIDLEIADSKDDVVTLSYKNVLYSITGDNEYSEAGITFDRATKEFK